MRAPVVLAAALAAAPAFASAPDLAAIPAPRLDALVRTRPDSLASAVRAHLARPVPAETRATVYVRRDGDAAGTVLNLGEHEVRIGPGFFPPNWFVAFRFEDKRWGAEPAFPFGDISLSAPWEGTIEPGVYTDAIRFPHQDTTRPGLSVRGLCDSTGGDFEIIELTYDRIGRVNRLGATFESPGCRGFLAYQRGTNDYTGGPGDGAAPFPAPAEPPPSLPQAVAAFAAEDPRLADLEIPDDPAQPTMVVYARGEEWIARGEKILMAGDGPEVRTIENWSPENRVIDLELRKPRPDGFVDAWRLRFMSPIQEEITSRSYPHAGNFPYQPLGHAGIKISGMSRGCNTAGGIFRVLELKRFDDGKIERFAADFEQHCEQYGPPLEGFVAYRAGR